MELKDYQRKAVNLLKNYIVLSFNNPQSQTLVFKAPTGSGKTFMASSLLEELANENSNINFCILWACPGTGELHKQSYEAVQSYLNGFPICTLLEDDFLGNRNYFNDKEIIFVNWEKLFNQQNGKWTNILVREQERTNFIDVINNTRNNGTKIILVKDESHIGVDEDDRTTQFINEIIQPNIVLEMSATPRNNPTVTINSQDVIEEGLIKKDIIVNQGINNDNLDNETDSETLILQKGFDKRQEIVNEYNKLGVNVNPLVLIQIPNTDQGETKREIAENFLRKKGITQENGRLKLWYGNNASFDKREIKRNNDITEYLIFKTAVATGWDCPRAHILIKFREGNSETFETQTIGRILRTAEAKSYNNDILDNAYIYTNLANFETNLNTYNPSQIKTEEAKLKDGYTEDSIRNQIQLKSFYCPRQNNKRADSSFASYFINSFKNYFQLTENDKNQLQGSLSNMFILHGMNLDLRVNDQIMQEQNIGVNAANEELNINVQQVNVEMAEADIQALYNKIIKDNLNGLEYYSSENNIKSAIVQTFTYFYDVFARNEKVENIMRIVINNYSMFSEILSNATRDYIDALAIKEANEKEIYDFIITKSRLYSKSTHAILTPSNNSIYQPLYVLQDGNNNPANNLETSFLNYLDNQNIVEWYYKNGDEHSKKNFGIPYNNDTQTFQPDYIIKFNNGVVGIFDTKPINYNVNDTTIKANALYNYIQKVNAERKNLPKIIGGIVVQSGAQFLTYASKDYHDYDENAEGWINFNELLRNLNNN